MYLLLALLGLAASLLSSDKQKTHVTALLLGGVSLLFMGLAAFWALPATEALVMYRTDLRQIPLCGVYFLVGASLYGFNAVRFFTLSNVVLVLVLWLSLSVQPQWFAMASWVVLPIVVMAFGLACHPWLVRMHARDYSYGIYIYAFPVQQTLVSIWPQMSLFVYLLSTFVTTVALAALSWHFVEKPALKLKPFRG
jgi:peptidoglycan/LPS O-acetylase OafA/YrhL